MLFVTQMETLTVLTELASEATTARAVVAGWKFITDSTILTRGRVTQQRWNNMGHSYTATLKQHGAELHGNP